MLYQAHVQLANSDWKIPAHGDSVLLHSGGWKKLEPMWDWVIRTRRVARLRPMLEAVLTGFGRHRPAAGGSPRSTRPARPAGERRPLPVMTRGEADAAASPLAR